MTTIDDKIRDEKLQLNVSRGAGKSTLSSGKIDKYEFITVREYCHLIWVIEQARFTYSSLDKGFGKQIKAIEYQGIKQVKVLKALKPKDQELQSIEVLFPKKVIIQ